MKSFIPMLEKYFMWVPMINLVNFSNGNNALTDHNKKKQSNPKEPVFVSPFKYFPQFI